MGELSAKPRDVLYELHRKQLAHPIQNGRWLVNLDRRPSTRPRLEALDPLAHATLRRLRHAWYLSWHSALWHYGLIDQQASRLYVAVTVRKRPARIGRSELRFVTVHPRKFFGWETIHDFSEPVQMATVEKALVDSWTSRATPLRCPSSPTRCARPGATTGSTPTPWSTLRSASRARC
jgi:predicted transcriptional regulator of viral defense system